MDARSAAPKSYILVVFCRQQPVSVSVVIHAAAYFLCLRKMRWFSAGNKLSCGRVLAKRFHDSYSGKNVVLWHSAFISVQQHLLQSDVIGTIGFQICLIISFIHVNLLSPTLFTHLVCSEVHKFNKIDESI